MKCDEILISSAFMETLFNWIINLLEFGPQYYSNIEKIVIVRKILMLTVPLIPKCLSNLYRAKYTLQLTRHSDGCTNHSVTLSDPPQ